MSEVPRKLSHTEEYIIAKNKVKTEHTITKVTVTPIGSKNGYLGEYFHLDMTIKKKNGESKDHRFFMKTLLLKSWKTRFLTSGIFQNEVDFYNDLSGRFRQYISTDVYPECYLAVEDKVVLADVTLQGYRDADLLQPFDYEHTKLGLEALARLHVSSIVHEEKTGRKVETDFPSLASELNFKVGSQGMKFLKSGCDAMATLIPYVDMNDKWEPEAVSKMRDLVGPWMEKLEVYLNENSPCRQVICHGDAWPANFLYRYDDQGKPVSAMMVDFQMTRLRSPAVDVNTFMYLSILTQDLKKWREGLLDAYYQVIVDELTRNGLDANTIYPKEEFLQAYIHYQKIGVIYTMLFFAAFSRVRPDLLREATSTPEKARKYFYEDRGQYCIDWYKGSPLLRRFVNDAVDEFYENFVKTNRGLTHFTQ